MTNHYPLMHKFKNATTSQHDAYDCLKLPRLPARLDAAQTAIYLGFAPHDVPILVAAKLLEPLGNPAPNGQKYFALCDLESCRANKKWLHAASGVISRHWQIKNGTYSPPPRAERRERRFSKKNFSENQQTAELSGAGELMKAE